jgi:uncharacterized protein (UPF0333 family)
MDEATKILRNRRGQAMLEYLLIVILALTFTRFVYFNPKVGFKASLDKTMLRLGVYLEQNLKSGTKLGEPGHSSTDSFAGISSWTN